MTASPVLVTGAAGFIGYHVARLLLKAGRDVVGLDSLNAYYDPKLKEARLKQLTPARNFRFVKLDLADREGVTTLFKNNQFPIVVHLAAQAGVRYSLVDPYAYAQANLVGFTNVLEGCRQNGCEHLVFASSSSVYGANVKLPFSVTDNVDHPISFYAATKKANEAMAHAYSHLYQLPTTGLRFFTVYGPWGRPDMAMYIFASAIANGSPIRLFNFGRMRRDFTYVDDVAEAVVRVIGRIPVSDQTLSRDHPNPAASAAAPWRLYNIGNNSPVDVSRVVELLETEFGRQAVKEFAAIQPGDVAETYADIGPLTRDVGFRPKTSIEEGVRRFVAWYREYHH